MAKLPKKIAELKIEIISVLYGKEDYLTVKEIQALVPERLKGSVSPRLVDMVKADKYLTVTTIVKEISGPGASGKAYKLTKIAEKIYENRDKIEVKVYKKYAPRMEPNQKSLFVIPKKQKKGAAAPPPPPPQAAPLNISDTAKNLMDMMTPLIKENADLRNLLLSVYELIGNALELNQGEQDDEHSN